VRILLLRFWAASSVAASTGTVAVGQIKPVPVRGGDVAGRIMASAGQRLPEIAVFLESTDPNFSFTPLPKPLVVSQQKATFRPSLIGVPVMGLAQA
jgi:hypothetical protein